MGTTTHKNLFVVLGKDSEGGYWYTSHLSPKGWELVAETGTEVSKGLSNRFRKIGKVTCEKCPIS